MPPTLQQADTSLLTDLGRRLVSGSLSDAALQRATEATPDVAILPWVTCGRRHGKSFF